MSHWERGRSVPSGTKLAALVRFANERGVVLLASDFGHRETVPVSDATAIVREAG